MELLSRLLGGPERVKIMRYFLHHEDAVVTLEEVAEKTKSKDVIARKEFTLLLTIGFIEKKRMKEVIVEDKKGESKPKEAMGFGLSKIFPHNQALKDLLFDFQLLDKKELCARFKTIGRIKLFVVSGVFIGDPKSRVDILIVGEAINRTKAEKVFDEISAELGRDVVYALMDVEEYNYRYKMYDKFIHDIMSMKRETIVDKMKGGEWEEE